MAHRRSEYFYIRPHGARRYKKCNMLYWLNSGRKFIIWLLLLFWLNTGCKYIHGFFCFLTHVHVPSHQNRTMLTTCGRTYASTTPTGKSVSSVFFSVPFSPSPSSLPRASRNKKKRRERELSVNIIKYTHTRIHRERHQ